MNKGLKKYWLGFGGLQDTPNEGNHIYLGEDVDPLLSPPGEGLTREQVQTYCNEIDKCIEDLCGSGRVNSDYLLEHDAAQRVEIARLKELLQRRSRIGDEDRALAVRLQAELEWVRGPESQVGSYAYYRKEVHRMHKVINEFCCLEEKLKGELIAIQQQLAAREGGRRANESRSPERP